MLCLAAANSTLWTLILNFSVVHGEWQNLGSDVTIQLYTQTGLTLHQGGTYSMRVGAVNKAGFVAAFETDGVVIDTTPPVVSCCYYLLLCFVR